MARHARRNPLLDCNNNIIPLLDFMKRLRLIPIALCLLPIALLCSCTRTVYTPVETERYHTDTLRIIQQRTDSILLRDSVSLITRNDTVFYTKYRDRTRLVERVDTVYKHIADSARISVPYPVEKSLSWWQRTKMACGNIAIWFIILFIGYILFLLLRKAKR